MKYGENKKSGYRKLIAKSIHIPTTVSLKIIINLSKEVSLTSVKIPDSTNKAPHKSKTSIICFIKLNNSKSYNGYFMADLFNTTNNRYEIKNESKIEIKQSDIFKNEIKILRISCFLIIFLFP
jgi:hypothetical protein